MPGSILGDRVIRKEDPKFLTTGGIYLDDLNDVPELAGAAHVAYVRSAVAHGTITSIDIAEAAGDARRVGVFTAADLGLEPAPSPFNPTVARTLLASDRVRYVGEPIAAVVTETREPGDRRRRGGDRRLRRRSTAVVDPEDALTTSTTSVRRRPAATSCSTRPRSACPTSPATSSSPAARSVVGPVRQPARRAVPARGARRRPAAWIDGRLHQWVSTQHAQGIKDVDRRQPTGSRPTQVRVITPDVGGGFGAKIGTYPEEIAARRAQPSGSAARCAGPRRAASR